MNCFFEIDRKRVLDYLDSITPHGFALVKNKKKREKMSVLYNRLGYIASWVMFDILPCDYENGAVIDTVDEYRKNILIYSMHKGVFFEENSLEKIIEDQMLEKWKVLEEENTLSLS